jgi:hypothetical protein
MPSQIVYMGVPGHHQHAGVLLYGITAGLDDIEIDDMRDEDRLLAHCVIQAEQVKAAQVEAASRREARTFAEDKPRF